MYKYVVCVHIKLCEFVHACVLRVCVFVNDKGGSAYVVYIIHCI